MSAEQPNILTSEQVALYATGEVEGSVVAVLADSHESLRSLLAARDLELKRLGDYATHLCQWRDEVCRALSPKPLTEETEVVPEDVIELLAARDKTIAEVEAERDAWRNVIAIIHRDGGHYRAEHGTEKTAADAIKVVCDERETIAGLEAERDRFRDTIKRVVTQTGDDLCWMDIYAELAELVGVKFNPALMNSPNQMLANCEVFVRELFNSGGKGGGGYKPLYGDALAKKNSELQSRLSEVEAAAKAIFEGKKYLWVLATTQGSEPDLLVKCSEAAALYEAVYRRPFSDIDKPSLSSPPKPPRTEAEAESKCPRCRGEGALIAINGGSRECPKCKGTGFVAAKPVEVEAKGEDVDIVWPEPNVIRTVPVAGITRVQREPFVIEEEPTPASGETLLADPPPAATVWVRVEDRLPDRTAIFVQFIDLLLANALAGRGNAEWVKRNNLTHWIYAEDIPLPSPAAVELYDLIHRAEAVIAEHDAKAREGAV